MKNLNLKVVIISILLVVALIIPTYVLATTVDMQIIHTTSNDYIIYVKNLAKIQFDFAISENPNEEQINLDYIKSVTDKEGNYVALIDNEKYETIKDKTNYLYVKNGTEIICEGEEINFALAFDQEKMQEVETTTKRIATELKTDIVKKQEEVEGVKITVTVGGLKITDTEEAQYYYTSTKLPTEKYSELMIIAEKINSDYKQMDMYTKIETAKQFYSIYTQLIPEQKWIKVDNMTIMQPEDAKTGEQYVVYLKKVDKNNKETIDVKLLTSYREDEEEKIPARTETKVVQETTKLPITYESMTIIIIFAIVVLALIFLFIRIKKLSDKKGKH